jgi:hypothetical protein
MQIQYAVSNSVSHFIVILIYPKGFHACVWMRLTNTEQNDSFTGVRPLVIVPLYRTLHLLSTRSPLNSLPTRLSRRDKHLPCEKPFMAPEAESCTGSGTRTIWMNCVGQGCGSGRTPEQCGSVADSVILRLYI